MDTVKVRRVAPPERRWLRRWKRRRTNQVNSYRARIILLSSGGVCNREIAQRVEYTPQWVRVIIHRFNVGGCEAIQWFPYFHGPRSPTTFTAELVKQIAEVALSPPKELIGMTQWSLAKLREYLIEQKIIGAISLEWLRVLLRRSQVHWRHTKTWKESNDPEFGVKYRRLHRLYGKRPADGRRVCVDEFGPLNLQPRHGQCLAGGKKRVERLRATYHRHGGVRHFLAAYDLETGRLFGRFTKNKTWKEFLSFLRWLRHRYPRKQRLYVVLDNFKPHIKAEVVTWAKVNNVQLVFTPTNASWLNRIECQFTALRKFALDNSDYTTHEEQQAAIESYLRWRNSQRSTTIQTWRRFKRKAAS
ncbi:MAG TPA: IS630 family transposase [Paracoccaceae bacterium]|nr:IS630 family transposase [Paracoccaceae bacterium]